MTTLSEHVVAALVGEQLMGYDILWADTDNETFHELVKEWPYWRGSMQAVAVQGVPIFPYGMGGYKKLRIVYQSVGEREESWHDLG